MENAGFWGEISPCEHVLQIYGEEESFLDALGGYVASGIQSGDAVIVIATPGHFKALGNRLQANGLLLDAAGVAGQFIPLDAEVLLSEFMVDGWPDENRFNRCILKLLKHARRNGREVRGFGEMVALLWERGETQATLELERLWHRLCQAEQFPLFCAYPSTGFQPHAGDSRAQICGAHSLVMPG